MTLKITTTKAPVGTPTCTRDPPSAEIRKPATTAVISPLSGEAPLAMPSAMASGNAPIAPAIGRAHVRTPDTNAPLVCRLPLEKTQQQQEHPNRKYTQ